MPTLPPPQPGTPVVGFPDSTLLGDGGGYDLRLGARGALSAAVVHRGRSVVVTATPGPATERLVDRLDPAVELVPTLESVTICVADDAAHLAAAIAAKATGVGVRTGRESGAELRAAGAAVVLDTLEQFPAWLNEHLLTTRLAALSGRLRDVGSLLVAFSGGADSAFLLAAAVRVLGPDRVVAATGYSDSLPQLERGPAHEFCDLLGVAHVRPRTREMDRAEYRANGGDRCYFCKAELLEVLGPLAQELGLAAVATGTNADDAVAGFRPGIRAAAERGALAPLRDAGLSKAQVREASRRWGLPTWDKPAAACLSSRIAYGVEVTPHRLARVERAEVAVRAAASTAGLRLRDVRVRDLGDTARIEVDRAAVGALAATPAVLAAVRATGFDSVEVDPRGFRSGAMNELLM